MPLVCKPQKLFLNFKSINQPSFYVFYNKVDPKKEIGCDKYIDMYRYSYV